MILKCLPFAASRDSNFDPVMVIVEIRLLDIECMVITKIKGKVKQIPRERKEYIIQ